MDKKITTFRGENLELLAQYRTVDQEVCIACGSIKKIEWAKSGTYKAVKCRVCSLIWMNPQINEEGLHKYYSDYIGNRRVNNEKKMQQRSIQYEDDVKFIEKFVNSGKMLDVGCSGGFFLENFNSNFEKFGIEIDPEAVKFANEKTFHNGQVKVECGTIEDIKFQEKFDLIVMRGSIEHVPNPVDSISRVADNLNKNGYFYITATPNANSFSAEIYRDKWTLFHPVQHLWHFSEQTLELICNRFGLELLAAHYPYLGTVYENVRDDLLRVAKDIEISENLNEELDISPPFFENMMSLVFRKK